MSVRSVFGGRLNATASSISGASPRMASQQLARFYSGAVRPSPTPASSMLVRPHTCPTNALLWRPAGLRAQSTASQASKDEVKLDWNSFFKLRASRRRYSLASSVVSSLASTTIGVQVLSSQDLESLGAQVMGLDPFIVLGLATAACGAVGWLLGPMVGNGVWGLVYRRFTPSVATVSRPKKIGLLIVLTFFPPHRKRKNSSIAFAGSAWIHLPIQSPTRSLTTTARRLEAYKGIASG